MSQGQASQLVQVFANALPQARDPNTDISGFWRNEIAKSIEENKLYFDDPKHQLNAEDRLLDKGYVPESLGGAK